MRSSLVLLCLALAACLSATQAASYRRADKISEHFKQLDLPPEEIDPNVAPLDSMNEVIFDNEVVDQAEEQSSAAAVPEDEIIEETAQSAAPVAVAATPAPAPAPATTAASAVAAAAAPAESTTPVKAEEESSNVLAKYCKCSGNHCDCCRAFNLPFIPVKGPGCARMSYMGNQKMAVSLKYGDLTLITRTVSSKRARPICVGLPGGYSQFCGRIYGLSKATEDFKACLGFELRADDEVEAALRVSCFKFGPNGLKVAEAEPLPSEAVKQEEDDDDIFGFGAGGDDDDDDYDEDNDDEEEEDEADDDEEADTDYADDDADNDEAPADADYGGFSLAGLLDELDDDDDDESKPSKTPAVASPATSAALEATRTADAVQSKDEKGTEATEVSEMMDEAAAATTSEDLAPATETTTDTKGKGKKSKKSRKNKKKKAADTGSGFAYDILNGLLDFFN